MPVQSVLIARRNYSVYGAIHWMEEHGFRIKKIHKTKKYYRFRQYDPIPGERYRTVHVTDDIKLIVAVY